MNNLHIRPLSLADADLLHKMIANNRNHLTKYFPRILGVIRDKASAQDYIEYRIAQAIKREYFFFVVVHESVPLGCVILKELDWTVPKGEVTYFVDEDYQQMGICSESMGWLVRHSFDELHLEKLGARIQAGNDAQRRVLEKNGFLQEGLLRNEFRDGYGNLHDVAYYGLSRH